MRLRRRVHPAVRALDVPERRLGWAVTTDGEPLVATATALHTADRRLEWVEVERVVWRPPVLTLLEVAEVEGTGPVRSWTLEQDVALAQVVRARVTSSVAWSDRHKLEPAGAVRLVGRRVPGEDALRWQAVYEPGTDVHDPLVREQVAEQLEALRRSLG